MQNIVNYNLMKEISLGYYENPNNKIDKKIFFLCDKVFKTPALKRVKGFIIGGSHAQGRRLLEQNKEQDDVDVDVLFFHLPNNGDLPNICAQMLKIFQDEGQALDIRYLIDVFGNHAVLNEETPGCVPKEIYHDFSRKDIKTIYSEEHPKSPFIVRSKIWTKLFFLK